MFSLQIIRFSGDCGNYTSMMWAEYEVKVEAGGQGGSMVQHDIQF